MKSLKSTAKALLVAMLLSGLSVSVSHAKYRSNPPDTDDGGPNKEALLGLLAIGLAISYFSSDDDVVDDEDAVGFASGKDLQRRDESLGNKINWSPVLNIKDPNGIPASSNENSIGIDFSVDID